VIVHFESVCLKFRGLLPSFSIACKGNLAKVYMEHYRYSSGRLVELLFNESTVICKKGRGHKVFIFQIISQIMPSWLHIKLDYW